MKILLMRIVLGVFFAFLLARFFFPGAGVLAVLGIGTLLVFFAYVFEAIHRKKEMDKG